MNLRPLHFRAVLPLLKDTGNGWLDDGALRLSAALACYSIFSIAPLLVIAIGLAGWWRHRPSGTLATAIGAGLLVGMATRPRKAPARAPLEPGAQARAGSRALLLAALLALGKAGHWLAVRPAGAWLRAARHRADRLARHHT